jgi:hypothetical protein
MKLDKKHLVNDRDKMSNPYREPSIEASYQVSVHLTKRFQRRILEIDQLEARIAKHGHHRQFLFLIGRFLKQLFL